jgi:epoxyqueuosine reductase
VKTAIRERALELGFDACQFTTARPPDSAAHFQRWLEAGRHGQMSYLERTARKRIEPGHVLPAARSIITLAVSYAGDEGSGAKGSVPNLNLNPNLNLSFAEKRLRVRLGLRLREEKFVGEIARYARFSDYHDLLGARLKALAEFVNHIGGADTRLVASRLWRDPPDVNHPEAAEPRSLCYVDTGPLLERDLAQRAGLGFIGKHTNLISRKLGNWFFLAEIITTLELPPDAPEKNRCGPCRRCLDACPTTAIIAPFQLDARRCISYLTIELKGPIPVELRTAVGNRIFGCDECLAVCPWNRFARAGATMAEHRRAGLESPDLAELLSLDEAGFRARFAGTPILRAKRRGFLRNVCVALGNIGGASALPALHRAASDPEPLIAEHASWAIEQINANCEL